ncbi:hypothetical protein AVEN_111536-1 [Araneus ventricosus]|uniref:Uncharacterized protein n=1 Tax=Araneus ventricosus TaxID=182803 RepID=A0A4Y2M2D9_ARAVE|nr:hypothetical protein AVEN_111536-1 [Araneus ventricosus]
MSSTNGDSSIATAVEQKEKEKEEKDRENEFILEKMEIEEKKEVVEKEKENAVLLRKMELEKEARRTEPTRGERVKSSNPKNHSYHSRIQKTKLCITAL